MQQEPLTNEQRLARLELAVSELQRQQRLQEARDIALLARIDGSIEDGRRMERQQLRAFESLETQLQELRAEVKGQSTEIKDLGASLDLAIKNTNVLAEGQRNHKEAIEAVAGDVQTLANDMHTIAQAQEQILALLGGQQKRND